MNKLFERVKAILLTPQAEWQAIARESGDAKALFIRYVAILALIPAVAAFIGSSLVGRYTPVLSSLVAAVVSYALTFGVVYAVACIVDTLAPKFETHKNFDNALKLTIYSYTPVWLAGIFMLIPGLSFLTIFGLYGLYLMWLGLPPMMQCTNEKSVPYAVAVVACAIVIAIALGFLHAALAGRVG